MKTVVCRIDLGYTRIAGYTLYDDSTMDFQETTPKEVMKLVTAGQVNGLTLNEAGEIIPDMDKWNLGNYKIKSAIGNYRNFDEHTEKSGSVYSVVRAIDIADTRVYEVISNKCARIILNAEQLLGLCDLAWVGGIKANRDTGTIELCDGVNVQNHTDRHMFEVGSTVILRDDTLVHGEKAGKSKNKAAKTEKRKK